MKRIFMFGIIFMPLTIALAQTIDFDTPVKWNSKVVESALTGAGFVDSDNTVWDVRVTRNRILEDLLSREMFSLHDATNVCMAKCNMSNFLKNGRGQSHKKCPELCAVFVENIITENNKQYVAIPGSTAVDKSFSGLEDNSVNVCVQLTSEAVNSGMTLPVLCGGTCNPRWDDIVTITDLEQTKEYKVDDFCDGQNSGDYFYILTGLSINDIQNVSNLNEKGRVSKMREIQTRPAMDSINREKANSYARRVEQNGYCKEINLDGGAASREWAAKQEKPICYKVVRKYAQSHACKLKSYGTFIYYTGFEDVYECFPNGLWDDDEIGGNTSPLMLHDALNSSDRYVISPALSASSRDYEYTPSYQDCVATFNEQDCDGISQGRYK